MHLLLAPRIYEGGAPKGRGESVRIRPSANQEGAAYRILPPGLRPSPLINEGGENAAQTGFPSSSNMFFLYASTPGWSKGLTPSR